MCPCVVYVSSFRLPGELQDRVYKLFCEDTISFHLMNESATTAYRREVGSDIGAPSMPSSHHLLDPTMYCYVRQHTPVRVHKAMSLMDSIQPCVASHPASDDRPIDIVVDSKSPLPSELAVDRVSGHCSFKSYINNFLYNGHGLVPGGAQSMNEAYSTMESLISPFVHMLSTCWHNSTDHILDDNYVYSHLFTGCQLQVMIKMKTICLNLNTSPESCVDDILHCASNDTNVCATGVYVIRAENVCTKVKLFETTKVLTTHANPTQVVYRNFNVQSITPPSSSEAQHRVLELEPKSSVLHLNPRERAQEIHLLDPSAGPGIYQAIEFHFVRPQDDEQAANTSSISTAHVSPQQGYMMGHMTHDYACDAAQSLSN